MGEQLGIQINPDSIRTEVVIGREPSLVGLPVKRMISTGITIDEKALYILLGSVGQIGEHIRAEGHPNPLERPVTMGNILRLRDSHPFDDEFDGVSYMDPRLIRNIVQEGKDLVIGPFALETRPGEHSLVIPAVEGIWAPAGSVLGMNWSINTQSPVYPMYHHG